ncbi:MAG: hypothetical protein ACRCTE_06060 [Cellulosilyticaceae bacterium]
MNTIKIYCKSNKRTKEDKSISVCAHIIEENGEIEEDVYPLTLEGNGVRLELAALMNALLDLEANERLNKDKQLELYVHNEHLVKTLLRWEETYTKTGQLETNQEEKYQEEWQEIGELLSCCHGFKVYGFEKKYREEDDEEVAKQMGYINKLVCEKVNEQMRGN